MLALSHAPYARAVDKVANMATDPTEMQDEGEDHYLGPWLKKLKKPQALLVQRLNVDKSTVSKWISHEREPSLHDLKRCAKVLGIRLEQLFYPPEDARAAARATRMEEDMLDQVFKKRLGD